MTGRTKDIWRKSVLFVVTFVGQGEKTRKFPGGVHAAEDEVKLLMAGANIATMCSALLRHGIDHLRTVEKDLRRWLEDHEYDSIARMQGSMSQQRCPAPSVFERTQYMRALGEYRPGPGIL